ncbi:MAG: hypothetical protein QOD74_403, partial [Variibacter sp.]|nr:hypothetical protein [Variibacter sp.]
LFAAVEQPGAGASANRRNADVFELYAPVIILDPAGQHHDQRTDDSASRDGSAAG